MTLWTVYDHPRDFPNSFIARAFDLDQPTNQMIVAADLEKLRGILESWGLTRLARHPEDDPCIVETWL